MIPLKDETVQHEVLYYRPASIENYIHRTSRRKANIDPRRFLTVLMAMHISTYSRNVDGNETVDYTHFIYNADLTNSQRLRRKEIFENIDRNPDILCRALRCRDGGYIDETSSESEEERPRKKIALCKEEDVHRELFILQA